METINPDDDSWVSATGLFGLAAIFAFMVMRVTPFTMNNVLWYRHRPDSFPGYRLWVIWFIVDVMAAVCLYTIGINVEHFSSPKNKLVHLPLVLFCMIGVTQIIEKSWVTVCLIPDERFKEKVKRDGMHEKVTDETTEKYYYGIHSHIFWTLSIYAALLLTTAGITLVLMGVDYMPNTSYKLVISLWAICTAAYLIGFIYTVWTFMTARKPTAEAEKLLKK